MEEPAIPGGTWKHMGKIRSRRNIRPCEYPGCENDMAPGARKWCAYHAALAQEERIKIHNASRRGTREKKFGETIYCEICHKPMARRSATHVRCEECAKATERERWRKLGQAREKKRDRRKEKEKSGLIFAKDDIIARNIARIASVASRQDYNPRCPEKVLKEVFADG